MSAAQERRAREAAPPLPTPSPPPHGRTSPDVCHIPALVASRGRKVERVGGGGGCHQGSSMTSSMVARSPGCGCSMRPSSACTPPAPPSALRASHRKPDPWGPSHHGCTRLQVIRHQSRAAGGELSVRPAPGHRRAVRGRYQRIWKVSFKCASQKPFAFTYAGPIAPLRCTSTRTCQSCNRKKPCMIHCCRKMSDFASHDQCRSGFSTNCMSPDCQTPALLSISGRPQGCGIW